MSGNGLPEHLSGTTGESVEIQVPHNWLYSVIPADRELERYKLSGTQVETISEIYLVGYCKNCNTAFSAPVPYSPYKVILSDMGIPKVGCSGPSF